MIFFCRWSFFIFFPLVDLGFLGIFLQQPVESNMSMEITIFDRELIMFIYI